MKKATTPGPQVRNRGMRAGRGHTCCRGRSWYEEKLYYTLADLILHSFEEEYSSAGVPSTSMGGTRRSSSSGSLCGRAGIETAGGTRTGDNGLSREKRQGWQHGALYLSFLPYEAGKAGIICRMANGYGDVHAEQSLRCLISLLRRADVNRISKTLKQPLRLSTPRTSDSAATLRVSLHT